MNESQNQLVEEWFSLSEEELFNVLVMEESTEEQMENAIIVLEEKFNYTHEQILEIAPLLAGIGRAALGAGSAIKKGYGAAKRGVGAVKSAGQAAGAFGRSIPVIGSVVGAGIDAAGKAKDIIGNNINPFKKDYVVHSLDDFLTGYKDPDKENDAAAKKAADDEKEKKANQPLKFINPKESYTGTKKMQKTFTQFREELSGEFFIENLDNESLLYILESGKYDEEIMIEATAVLIDREVISIEEAESWWTKPIIGGSDPKAATKAVQRLVGTKDDGKWGAKSEKAASESPWISANALGKAALDTAKKSMVPPSGKDSRTTAQKFGWRSYGKSTTGTSPGGKPSGSPAKPEGSVPNQGAKPSSSTASKSVKPITPAAKSVTPQTAKSGAVKPAAPIKKSIPSANKPSAAMNDLRQSVDKLRGTASAAATATNRAKTALSKVPGTGRMSKPTSRGGMSSSAIHSAIGKLGGEPTRAAPRPTPTLKVPAQTKQGAPRASSSKPPTGGKWM